MTWLEALEITDEGQVERIRWLCSEANPDPETRAGYRAFIVRRATGEPEPVATAAPSPPPDSWLPLIRACDDFNPGCCASPMPFCSRFARNTSRDDCIACLSADGITPP